MNLTALWFALSIYLLLGLCTLMIPTLRKEVRKGTKDVTTARNPPWKVVVFHSLIFISAVVVWPIVLSSAFKKPRMLLDEAKAASGKIIVAAYREIAAKNGIPPTTNTSDEKIIEVYSKVVTAFRQAAKQRGEHIPALFLNHIVVGFLQIYETCGPGFFDEHLRYEVEKYVAEGLRPDYKRELPLF
jgi:hypothetical protein